MEITTASRKTVYRNRKEITSRCEVCQCPATHGVNDCTEMADGTFEESSVTRRGCDSHKVTAMTRFLDGRVMTSEAALELWEREHAS